MCCAMKNCKLTMSFSQDEAFKSASLSTPAHPATEALDRQLVDNKSKKRRKIGGCGHRRLPLDGLGVAFNSSSRQSGDYRGEEYESFPQIVDICSLDSSRDDLDEYNSDGYLYELANLHLGKRCRGVVRSQTIPSRMWLMDEARSLATAR